MFGSLRARVAGICVIAGVTLLGLAVLSPSVNAANPLTGWTRQGGSANWQVQPAGDSVYVVQPNPNNDNANGPISFFVSPAAVFNKTFRVTISANQEAEEGDYIGFALGYQAPLGTGAPNQCTDEATCNTNFYLFDWKEQTEIVGGAAEPSANGGQEGFSLMKVAGARDLQNNNTLDRPACFWTHQDVDNFCDVLGTRYGSNQGYSYGVAYTFEVVYTATQLKISFVNAQGTAVTPPVFDIAPTPGTQFPSGRLAFYNYSQPNVEYFFDDGTTPATTTTSTTPTTIANTTTTAGATGTTTRPTVGPVTRSSLVRTGPDNLVTALQLSGGIVLLVAGAVLTATRGKRPQGRYYA